MSDISIPGVTSKYNTDKMVEALVKAESIPLDRMKEEQKALEARKKEWQDLNRMMNTLRTASRALFSFENPFAERTATSSDPAVGATATREASEGTTRITVVKLAQADRFASNPVTKDTPVPDGTYTFQLGDETIRLRFRGGTVKEFADALSRQADGKIKASILQNRTDSQVLLIESLKTGAAWPLSFKDDALKLGLDLGLIAEDKGTEQKLALQPDRLQTWTKPLADQKNLLSMAGDTLTVRPGGEAQVPLPAGFNPTEGMVLEYQVRARARAPGASGPTGTPDGPVLAPGPGVNLKDVALPDLEPKLELPSWTPPDPPEPVVDNIMVFARAADGDKTLPAVIDSADFKTVQVPLSSLGNGLAAIGLRNGNTDRELDVRAMRIVDPGDRGKYKPLNPVSVAQDAQVRLEGIDIFRDTNTLKDLIPGVTLALNTTTEKPVAVKVEPDRKLVKDKLIEFVANYNAVVREINIATARPDATDVVTEVEFFTDKEKEDALKRLGMFQGESTLSMIKSRLQNILANAYQTVSGQSMAMLAQAGISTNAGQAGGGVSTAKLRGYLEINEKTLDKAMAEYFLALKDIFGSDTNGDRLPDAGVGVELDKYLQSYVQIGGILASKTAAIDTQIRDKDKEIKDYQVKLKDYEAQLKVKYGKMEAAVNSMQQSTKSLESLNSGKN